MKETKHRPIRRPQYVEKRYSEEDAEDNYVVRNILEAGSKRKPILEDPESFSWKRRDGYGQVRFLSPSVREFAL